MEVDEPATTSHKGEKVRSYTISFKLQVIEYAENHSIAAAAQKYKVDRHSIRDWKKKKNMLQEISTSKNSKKRIRLEGGGRKPLSNEMEETLLEWIMERRLKMLRVSRKIIRKKALLIYEDLKHTAPDRYDENFEATTGWLFKFMKRNNLSLRRKTSVAQKDPDLLISKIVSYILRVRRLRMKYSYQPSDIIVFDETPVWADMVSDTTVDVVGKKTVSMKTTGHEKCRVTAGLAAKSDGTKLKPIIVFKGAKREVEQLQKEYKNKCFIATSTNGWMDTDLTLSWVNTVLGQFSFRRRLLAWDTYECHLMPVVQKSLKTKKIDAVFVPGGCTKYIQAPDVSWNKPFKAYCTEKYDEWLEAVGIHQETDGGNLKPPPRRTIVNWILDSWNQLSSETISKSFKACALTSAIDGSEDNNIHCLKEGQPCHSGLSMLAQQIELANETEDNPFRSDDITTAPQDELCIIEEDEEGDSDVIID